MKVVSFMEGITYRGNSSACVGKEIARLGEPEDV